MQVARILLLIVFVFPRTSFTQPASELANKIDRYLAEKFPASEPGGAVLVARGEKVILRKAYGLADKDTGKPNTAETIFRIGSITKQFTSTAILKLASEGKVTLEDPITKFFPDYPMGEKPITIRHLLNHTSGIKSYTSLPEIVGSKESKERSYNVDEVINAFKNKPKDFAPGDNYLYNNSAYYLLGALIEKVTGQSWADYLQQQIFTPLGMKSTYCDDQGLQGEAVGYYKWKKSFRKADVVHPSASYAAGAIASTVDDLWKWNKAVFSGTVVSLDLLNEAWTPVKLNDGATRPYGFGWQLQESEPKIIGHGGTIDGFQSYAWYVPDSKTFVVVLSNNMGSSPVEYTNKILELIQGKNVPPKVQRKEINLDPRTLTRYEGEFELFPDFIITIKKDQDKLLAQATGQSAHQIFPESELKFFYKVVDAQLEFSIDDSGKVVSLTLYQNGKKMPGKKTK